LVGSRRRCGSSITDDHYRDFSPLLDEADAPMVFFGGKDYAPPFA
jgi:hypothetical protein